MDTRLSVYSATICDDECRQGDPDSYVGQKEVLGRVLLEKIPRITRSIFRLENSSTRDEIEREAVLDAWKGIGRLDISRGLDGWLRTTVYHAGLRVLGWRERSTGKPKVLFDSDAYTEPIDSSASDEPEAPRRPIIAMLLGLTPQERLAWAYFRSAATGAAVSAVLGCPSGSLRAWTSQMRDKLLAPEAP